jgi:hypothetical protein
MPPHARLWQLFATFKVDVARSRREVCFVCVPGMFAPDEH